MQKGLKLTQKRQSQRLHQDIPTAPTACPSGELERPGPGPRDSRRLWCLFRPRLVPISCERHSVEPQVSRCPSVPSQEDSLPRGSPRSERAASRPHTQGWSPDWAERRDLARGSEDRRPSARPCVAPHRCYGTEPH
uniref:Uncharacterized protein n=1 Tax=Molossus molossus TaxID=27622 RepID=A0A7J8JWG4_MOLMO|nr:hypothetical protein HJG59_008129 [Molossus molossus]